MSKANSLLQNWLSKQTKAKPFAPQINAEKEDSFPLSDEQMRLWVLAQLHPNNPVYNFILAFSFSGGVDLARLTNAINNVLQKHDVLNAIINSKKEGLKHQVKQERISVDLKNIGSASIEEARSLAIEEAKIFGLKPFALDSELVRARVLNLGNGEFWLVFVAHHLVFDKQSAEVLKQEIIETYDAKTDSELEQISDSENSFADYIFTQQSKTVHQATIAFWKKLFLSIPEPIAWPFDETENEAEQFAGGYMRLIVPESLLPELTVLAQKQNTSLFVVMLALYKTFLALYLDTTDICVGVPVTNRIDEKWQNTIGFFDNTLALRGAIDLQAGFSTFITQIKNEVAEAIAHREMPFHDLVKLVSPERSTLNPLFQTMLIYHESISSKQSENQFNVNEQRIDLGVSKFDLTLYCHKHEDSLELIFETADRIFSKENKLELKLAFRTFIEKLQQNWQQPLSALNLLNKKQEKQVLVDWCGGDNVENQGNSIPEIFSTQVEKNLDKCAVSDGTVSLSYKKFDQEIEKLCSALRVSGIREGAIIAICLERSIAAVIVVYALHRLGAAYVPIDPSYPKGRLALMMEESKAVAVITDEKNAGKFNRAKCVLLLDLAKIDLITVIGKLQNEAEFHKGAYILFTSGSTGKPKGVQISQSNLVHSNQNRFSFYDKVPARFLQLPSFSFDSSVAGLFWPLCGGGSLFVPPHGIEHDLEALANFISVNKITTTLILPSLYALLLEHAEIAQLSTLETIIVAGEATTTKLVDTHYSTLPNCKLYNEYGPTEASVWSTACMLNQGDKKVPIGRPLNNTQVYLLNSAMQPVLPSHVGELYIGGNGLSSGYINSPLENNSFVGNPNNKNKRMYRTGDLARFDATGSLLFVGRKDQQVKINGKRVELQEISTSIASLAGVDQAHVLYQEVELNNILDSEDQLTAERYYKLYPSRSVEILRQIQAYGPEELNALLDNLEE